MDGKLAVAASEDSREVVADKDAFASLRLVRSLRKKLVKN
jgi:hypothetical protein